MVAETANCSAEYAEAGMPLARGLQYVTIWWNKRKVRCLVPTAEEEGDSFGAIAGF